MNYKRDAYDLVHRMLDCGATVDDLLPAVTVEMMRKAGDYVARRLVDARRAWRIGWASSYQEPRGGTAWAICVKRDLTVEARELEHSIACLKNIELIDKHDRTPVMPFLMDDVVELGLMSSTVYQTFGHTYGFPILLERGR